MGTDQMHGWTTRIAGDTTVEQRYILDKIDSEFARYMHPLSATEWSDAKEIQRAGIGRHTLWGDPRKRIPISA